MENKTAQRYVIKENIFKNRVILWVAVLLVSTVLVNCRTDHYDDGYVSPSFETQIVSDVEADGDIAFSPPNNYTVASANVTGTVLAGINPADGDEFRGFFAFPLRGGQGVPLYADIESATLEIFINTVTESSPGAGVPLIFDLVSFSPPILIADDFNRPPLRSLYANVIFADDAGFFLTFDVTSLMIEAQRRDLTNFQIRLLLDSALASAGLIEIDDNLLARAPVLTVAYY